MTNWRSHVLEPFVTAVIVIGVALIVLIVLLVSAGGFRYLPIAFFLGIFYPLILAVPWVALTATFSWLLRRQARWMSLAVGGCVSVLLACLALSPKIANALTSANGFQPADTPVLVLLIVVFLMVSLVQTFVHMTLRAREKREPSPELS